MVVVTCSVCPKMFPDPSSLAKHMRKHTGEKPYTCDTCGNSFTQKPSLKLHMRIHTGEKPFKCEVCDKAFSQNALLTVHMRRHTGERPYLCHYCPMGFACFGSRKRHMRVHTGDKDSIAKTFICPECPKTFESKTFLDVHFRVHTGEKPFGCTVCPKTFASKGNLQKHLEVHERNIGGEKPFLCYLCTKSFALERYLKQHIQNVHKEVYAVEKPMYNFSSLLIQNFVKKEVGGDETDNKDSNFNTVENNEMKNIKEELNQSNELVPDEDKGFIDGLNSRPQTSVIKINPYKSESSKISPKNKTLVGDVSDDSGNRIKNEAIPKESIVPQVIQDESREEASQKDSNCPLCDFKISKDKFNEHMESAHETCEHCGYQSISKFDLNFHVEFEHEDVQDPLKEEATAKETQNPDISEETDFVNDSVVRPVQYEDLSSGSESGTHVKEHQCDYCPKLFSDHGSLLRHHLHMHKGEKWHI